MKTATLGGHAAPHIVHREFIRNIQLDNLMNVGYNEISVDLINPTNNILFPWLAGVAANYESYRIAGMRVVYETMLSEFNANASGTIMMAFDYNVADSDPTSKQELLNFKGAMRCKPSTNASLMFSKKDGGVFSRRFIAPVSGTLPTNADPKLYHAAKLIVAADVQTVPSATINVGELWIEYDFVLDTPDLENSFAMNNVQLISCIDGFASDKQFGDTFSYVGTGNITIAPHATGSSNYDITDASGSGYYLIAWLTRFTYTGTYPNSHWDNSITAVVGGSYVDGYGQGWLPTTGTAIAVGWVLVHSTSSTFTIDWNFPWGTYSMTLTDSTLRIFKVSGDIAPSMAKTKEKDAKIEEIADALRALGLGPLLKNPSKSNKRVQTPIATPNDSDGEEFEDLGQNLNKTPSMPRGKKSRTT